MKKVLICLNSIRRGGMEMSAISFQHSIKDMRFCYYIRDDSKPDEQLMQQIMNDNAELVCKPKHIKSRSEEYKWLKKYMQTTKFDVVHSHMQYHSGLILKAAYKAKVKKRVAHSHFSKNNRPINIIGKLYRKLMRIYLNGYSTDILACSKGAGEFLYGKAFDKHGVIINNGIDMSRYEYDFDLRTKKRYELNIDNEALVVGHIGSVYQIKNQVFLIKAFNEIKKTRPNSVLLLCGEIRDDGEAQKLVKELDLENSVKFLGIRSDASELLMAMDVLVFPSLFEALPIVPIEAQATGLPCLLSDRIISDIKKNDNVEFMPLEELPENWAKRAIELSKCDRNKVSTEELKKSYDINSIAKQLEKIYEG